MSNAGRYILYQSLTIHEHTCVCVSVEIEMKGQGRGTVFGKQKDDAFFCGYCFSWHKIAANIDTEGKKEANICLDKD